jgi:hypothetical protein
MSINCKLALLIFVGELVLFCLGHRGLGQVFALRCGMSKSQNKVRLRRWFGWSFAWETQGGPAWTVNGAADNFISKLRGHNDEDGFFKLLMITAIGVFAALTVMFLVRATFSFKALTGLNRYASCKDDDENTMAGTIADSLQNKSKDATKIRKELDILKKLSKANTNTIDLCAEIARDGSIQVLANMTFELRTVSETCELCCFMFGWRWKLHCALACCDVSCGFCF